MDDLIIAIDSGTTSNRIMVFNLKTGKIESICQKEIKQVFPKSGWMEEDAEEIFTSVQTCLNDTVSALNKKGFKLENIKGIGITNQRETTIVWDKTTGKPLHNAIVWSDTRTTDLVKKYTVLAPDKSANGFMKVVGLPLSTYFSALKLCWLLQNVADVKTALANKTLLFGTVDCWLIWKLTNGASHLTDVTNASRTMLMNLTTLQWDDGMCKFFKIDPSILPKIMSSSQVFGKVNLPGPENQANGIPITGVLGDQQASLVGQNCTSVGSTKCTFGTGAFLLTNIGEQINFSTHGLLTTVAYQFGPKAKPVYAYEGSIPVAAGAINWLGDSLGLFSDLNAELDKMVSSVKDNGGCYFVPAFNGLFCPHWRPDARGIIVGLSQTVNKNHLCRAAMEAIAFQTKDIILAMKSDSDSSISPLDISGFRIDGGVANSRVFNQILADICELNVDRPDSVEATALGAAIAAARGLGLSSKGLETSHVTTFSPKLSPDAVSKLYKKWKLAVKKSFD